MDGTGVSGGTIGCVLAVIIDEDLMYGVESCGVTTLGFVSLMVCL